jgi:hypothetical protein
MKYVIYKSTRTPSAASYNGPTWDFAGIRHLYKETYENKVDAEKIAAILTEHNGVGFSVEVITNEVV